VATPKGSFYRRVYFALRYRKNVMEADEINVIANTLADLAQRTAELRRYL
jgi:hypothetical protein